MRKYTDAEVDEMAQFLFYKLVWDYIDFYDDKRFNQFRKFEVYEDMIFTIHWKKLGCRHFIFTEIEPRKDYAVSADDTEVLDVVKRILSPKVLDRMILWYKDCEKRVNKGQLPTAQPDFR
jgi:hypothetical protein